MDLFPEYSQFYKRIEHTFIDPQKEVPCLEFLKENHLSGDITSYVAEKDIEVPFSIYGIPVKRSARTPKEQLKIIRKETISRTISAEVIWNEHSNIKDIIKKLDFDRMPADSIAFYRPFHFEPFEEWGIYIYIDKLVDYCKAILMSLAGNLALFSDLRDIMSCVLFEIFHHEFFHHIVESAATTIEIVTANYAQEGRPYYRDYLRNKYRDVDNGKIGVHPDDPLEEALANAYAYNSFSFYSRVKFGYKVAAIEAYKKILKRVWRKEPRGYCYAERYIDGCYKNGSSLLLSQILCDLNNMTPETVGLISQRVLLKGNSAFMEKANIPVYMVGSGKQLEEFHKLIPAPNETYTGLFMAHDNADVDKRLQEIKQQNTRKGKRG